MWATLALAAVVNLPPAQSGGLKITNVRATYGLYGTTRKDDKKFHLGDFVTLHFDIKNLKVNKDGEFRYAMGTTIARKGAAKPIFKRDPDEGDMVVPALFGETTLHAFAYLDLRLDTPPGDYVYKITVIDRNAKRSESLEYPFEVLKPAFAFVRLVVSPEGAPVPPIAVPGQTMILSFDLVGFKLGRNKQPDISVEVRPLNDEGKPTGARPLTGRLKQVSMESDKVVQVAAIRLPVNKAGKYKIAVKAIDNNNDKATIAETLDLVVIDPKKFIK
jgi:hypothetical protein